MVFPPLLDALARSQHGLLTRQQILGDLSSSQLHRRQRAGFLIPAGRGVYRVAGATITWRQRALAACLAVGDPVAVSHWAAGAAWRVPSLMASPQIELSVPPERSARTADPIIHRRPLPAVDIVRRWGIPVTSAARTVIDLSTVLDRPLLGRVADDLLRVRQLDIADLAERLRAGAPLPRLRRADLEEIILRRGHDGVGASAPEDWVFDTIVAAGLPVPVRHHRPLVGGSLRELDCAYPELLIGIDYDGWSVHRDAEHFHKDRDRLAAFQLEGWILLQVTFTWSAELLVERVRAAIDQRRTHPPGAGWAGRGPDEGRMTR